MDVLSILPFIYDAAMSQDHWMHALDHVTSGVSAKHTMLVVLNKSDYPYSVNTSSQGYIGKEPLIEQYIREYGHYDQEALQALQECPLYSQHRDIDIWPDFDRLRERPDIEFIRKNFGIFRRAGYNLSFNKAVNAGIILQYDKKLQTIPKDSDSQAKILLPHISKAIEINRFYFRLQEQYNAILSALNHVKIGVCVFSPEGQLVIANAEAEKIFDQKDGIAIDRNDRIISSDIDLRNQIEHFVLANSETAKGRNHLNECVLSVLRRSGREPFLLEISPLRDADGEYEKGFAGALVTIIDPDNTYKYSVAPLKELYGLTNAETEIARLLANGYALKKISDIRGVAEDTVKNQTKSIYSKVNVRNRSQLIRKIVSISPPIN